MSVPPGRNPPRAPAAVAVVAGATWRAKTTPSARPVTAQAHTPSQNSPRITTRKVHGGKRGSSGRR